MLRRMLRLTVLVILLVAAVLTPRQSGAAGGGSLPAGTANPARPPAVTGRPPTAVGWQAPRRLRSGVAAGAAATQEQAPAPARAGGGAGAGHGAVAAGVARDLAQGYGSLPLAFEPNVGQTDPSVAFLAHGQGYTAFLTQDGITLALAPLTGTTALADPAHLRTPRLRGAATAVSGPALRLQLVGAGAQAQPLAQDPLPGVVNYLLGSDPSTWHTNIATYGQVTYPDVYPGVDLVYHGQQNNLALDFVVHPGAQVSAIRLQLAGVSGAAPNSAGDLVIGAGGATLRALQPSASQDLAGQHRAVGAHYRLLGGNAVGLTLDAYDASQPVTIDPVLVYSSYLGGSGGVETPGGIAVDSTGAAYLTGATTDANFPVVNPYQGSYTGTGDAFVSKVNAAGNGLVYSTFLGGNQDTAGTAIAVDSSGSAYLTGYTTSNNYPVRNAFQPSPAGPALTPNAIVTKLSAAGNALVYSSYLGGSVGNGGYGIAVDGSGAAYVAGETQGGGFPLVGAEQPTFGGAVDAFVSKVSAAGSSLVYSTYLGGTATDQANAIAVDGSGAAYVTGYTDSANFPLANAEQIKPGGGEDAFVSKLAASGATLAYSTYLGGTGNDYGQGIAVDGGGAAYVTGLTASGDFPLAVPVQANYGGGDDAFVSKLSADGTSLAYSTYLGGSGDDAGLAIAVDATGAATVAGSTASSDFRTVNPEQSQLDGSEDGYVARLNPTGSALAMATYLGGSGADQVDAVALDGSGGTYVFGATTSSDFPTVHGFQGVSDMFVAKLGPPSCTVGTAPASSGTVPWHRHYTTRITSMLGLSVDLADGHADLAASDMQITGRGPDLVVQHTWDSTLALGCKATSNGSGWVSDLTPSMSGAPGSAVTYVDATGARWVFPYVGGAYQTPAGLPYSLTANGSGYSLSNILTGETLSFDSQGRYTQDTDAYGNYNSLAQSGGGAPTSETNHGSTRALTMTYFNGLLNDIQSPIYHGSGPTAVDGQHVAYGYDGSALTSIAWGADSVDPQTHATDQQAAYFGYTGDLLTSVTTPMTISGTLLVTREWTLGYDSSNRLISVTSPISGSVGQAGYEPAYTTLITYGSGSAVVREGYGTPNVINTSYALDSAGRATVVTDGLSHTTRYAYDADNDVTSRTDGNNHTTNYYYQYVGPPGTGGIDSTGQVTETVRPAISALYPDNSPTAPTTHFVYDPSTHDLTETYDNQVEPYGYPSGSITYYTYDGHHAISTTAQLVTATTGLYQWRGQIRQYDPQGELTGLIDGRGVDVPATFSSSTVPTVTPDSKEASTYTHSWSYDAQGNLASASTPPIITSACPSTPCPAVTHYTYDVDGNLATLQSADNANAPQNVSVYGYDHLGRENSVKQPPLTLVNPPPKQPTGVPLSTVEFDGDGNVAMAVAANGADLYTSYDPMGRLVATQEPLSLRTEPDPEAVAQTALTINTYSATNLQSVQDPEGHVTNYTYDAANRLLTATNAAGQEVTYGYDAADNLTSIKVGNPANPSSTITRTYDALDEVATQAVSGPGLSGSLTTTYSYDLHGHVVRQQDPNNDTSFASYDLADELLLQELDPGAPNTPTQAHLEQFGYDAAGNRTAAVDFARASEIAVTVDGDNRAVQDYAADPYNRNVPTITTSATFDPDGNLVGQTEVANGQTHTFSASLNPADWPQQATNDALSSSTVGDGGGDLLSQTIQGGAGTVAYNIDQTGRQNEITVTPAGGSAAMTIFNFNDNEQLTGELQPYNIEQDATYDAANRLSSLTAVNNSNHALLNTQYQYGYDPLGLTDAITTTVQGVPSVQTLTHDAAGRLTAASGGSSSGSWSYDGRGNLTSATFDSTTSTYSYSASNPEEVASVATSGQPATDYGYDGDGDTTSITNTGTLNRQLSYDVEQRLVQVTLGSPVTETITLAYNAFGQRASYTVTPTGKAASLVESFKYQGDQLAQVAYSGSNITTPYTDTYVYTQDGNPLELLRQARGAGTATPYWYVVDGQGNVVALTDGTGHVVDSYTYDQWGRPISISEPSVHQQLRYAGYWYDNELGWYWLAVRYYDPMLERFLQPDPSELEGLFSYIYAGDSPSNLGDASGLISTPLQTGCLLTTSLNFECNLKVGSDQWNAELGRGAKIVDGEVGALLAALLPVYCGNSAGVCLISLRTLRSALGNTMEVGLCFSFSCFWNAVTGAVTVLCNATICGDVNAIQHGAWYVKILGAADIVLYFVPGVDVAGKAAEYAIRGGIDLGEHLSEHQAEQEATRIAEDIARACVTECFPAGTLVATPHGSVPIDKVKVGDQVLTEDPTTGKVTAERVVAMRHDAPTWVLAIGLADGSTIEVTPEHPFWVDRGANFVGPGWLRAGELRVGDQLRTASGQYATIAGLRYHVARVEVYTLTLGQNHDFFVGSARVLVHNCGLQIIGSNFSPSELKAAQYLAENGHDVILREAPAGATRASGETSDLIVNGVLYDVYTPEAGTTVRNILSEAAGKWTQVHGGGVVIDLSNTSLTEADFGNALARANGFIRSWNGTPLSNIIFIK